MDEYDKQTCMCERESLPTMLRRRSLEMHNKAVRLEKIAKACERMSKEESEALYDVLVSI